MNEPLTVRALAALVLAAIADVIAVFGVELPAGWREAVIGLVGAGVLVYLVIDGRMRVTPVASPKDADGAELVRKDSKPLKKAKR